MAYGTLNAGTIAPGSGNTLTIDETVDVRGPTGTGTASAGVLRLSTAELTVVDADQLGRIEFIAPLESSGTDAILVGASIYAEADDTFAADNNATELIFATGASEAATEQMRIASDGKIGVNCSDPGAQVDIRGVAGTGTASAGVLRLSTAETTVIDADQLGRIEFIAPLEASGTDAILVGASIYAEADAEFAADNNATELVFATGASETAIERMRIDSSGDLTLSTAGAKIHLSGSGIASIYATNGLAIGSVFGVDSFLLFTSELMAPVTAHGAGYNDDVIDLGNSSARFDDIWATTGTINTSDEREKNTIVESDLGLDFVNALSPKSFIFNNKTRTHYGLIAQDIETLLSDIGKSTQEFAGFIKSPLIEIDGTDTGEVGYGLRMHEFISPMIKAIQELSAKVTALENA